VTDEPRVQAIAEWRRGYNLPVGLWHQPDPEAAAALRALADRGIRAAVISNSNGSVRSILTELGLADTSNSFWIRRNSASRNRTPHLPARARAGGGRARRRGLHR